MTGDEPRDEGRTDDEPPADESREDELLDEESPGDEASDGGPPDDEHPDSEAPDGGNDGPDGADETTDDPDDGEGGDGEPSSRADDVPGEGDGTPDEAADAPPDRPDDLSVEPSETLDGGGEDGPKSLGERLHEFAVDLLETGTAAGGNRGGRITYGYTARTGPRGPASPHRRRSPRRADESPDAHASVDRDGDDLRVTVDLPDVDPDDLTVGVDPERDALVVADEGRVLARVPLEGADDVVDCWLNNHVLTVHLRDR